jgi:hypothetical protein
VVQSWRNQDGVGTYAVPNQPHKISSPESVNSWRKDVTWGIQPKFVYQYAFPNYYEVVEENTNINVVEEIEENYLRSFEYAEAHVNVLDQIPQSYSHQRNPKLDQTRYTI